MTTRQVAERSRTVEFVTLAEIATEMYQGSGIPRDQIAETGTPCVRYNELYTTYGTWFDECVSHTDVTKIKNPKWFGPGDILFTSISSKIEDIGKACAYVGTGECLASEYVVVMKHEQNPRYLAHVLATDAAIIQKRAGSVVSKVIVRTSLDAISKIVIPLPPLDEQARLAAILDKFEMLVNDRASGIRAEIAAREAQYEYYRDELMKFKRCAP